MGIIKNTIEDISLIKHDSVEPKLLDLYGFVGRVPDVSMSGISTKLDEMVLTSRGSIPWMAVYLPFLTSKLYRDTLNFSNRISYYIDNNEENRAPNSVGLKTIINNILENNIADSIYMKFPKRFVFS